MARGRFERDKRERRAIARERMEILMGLAEEAALSEKQQRADRYATLARSIGMRYNARLPRAMRMRICKGCSGYLLPGRSAKVRTSKGMLTIECGSCGRVWRMPLAARRVKDETGKR